MDAIPTGAPSTGDPSGAATAFGPAWRGEPASSAFVYPPVDPGFPALATDELLAAHAPLLSRIKVCYGADRESFERELLPLLRRYAAFVHLLPATPANYFNVPGGLLQLGLETAFFSLQGTDAHIFSGRATITTRRHLEPRWRLATFIAGLCAEIHRTLNQVVVTDREGNEWPFYLQPLQQWLTERTVDRYFLKWIRNAPESPGVALYVLPHVVPAATLQHLAQSNTVVVPHMLAALSAMPLPREHNIVAELVRRAAALVIARNLQASADRYGRPQLGSHLERYLVDALRRLMASNPAWMPNGERSRVWYGADGLFIVWPSAASDVRKLLEADQLPGIPKAPETMLEILLGAGVLQAQADGQTLWAITPPGAKTALEAVKLCTPATLLSGIEQQVAPLSAPLVAKAAAPRSAAESPKPAPAAAPPEDTPAPPEAGPTTKAPSTEPTQTALEPQQLQLLGSRIPPSEPDSPLTEVQQRLPAPATIVLDAPLRLAPRVRAALTEIIGALHGDGDPPMACVLDAGLFVALSEFERRHVEPSQALRALAEAHMLAPGAEKNGTATQVVSDQPHLGLIISPSFLTGWLPPSGAPSREA